MSAIPRFGCRRSCTGLTLGELPGPAFLIGEPCLYLLAAAFRRQCGLFFWRGAYVSRVPDDQPDHCRAQARFFGIGGGRGPGSDAQGGLGRRASLPQLIWLISM